MLKNNGIGEEEEVWSDDEDGDVVGDVRGGLGRGGSPESGSTSHGTQNGAALERPGIEGWLRRSRSISSPNDDIGLSTTAILPGPLRPSVRRLHSSPNTFGKSQTEVVLTSGNGSRSVAGAGVGKSDSSKEDQLKHQQVAKPSVKRADGRHEMSPLNGGPSDGLSRLLEISERGGTLGTNSSSSTFSSKVPMRLPSGREVLLGPLITASDKATAARLNLTRLKFEDDSPPQRNRKEVDSAQAARNAWKPRVRAETDGIENLPLWPTKSHRTGAGVLGQQRHISSVNQTGNAGKQNASSSPDRAPSSPSTPGRKSYSPTTVEKKDLFPALDGGGGSALRKRRGVLAGFLEPPEDGSGGGSLFESGVLDPASKRKLGGISSPRSELSSNSRRSSNSYAMGLIRHKSHCSSLAIILLFLLTVLSILYAIAITDQVFHLEKKNIELRLRVKECSALGSSYQSNQEPDSGEGENDGEEDIWRAIRTFALLVSLSFLSSPFLIYKYVDQLPRLGFDNRRGEEGVPLSKRLAYRIDVLFSSIPFFKPLALLLATFLLIGVGGIALFSVSDENMWDAFWRAWTYVADAGNHADSTGTGPRIVSICISFGGMLIFALMLGLVSDAISEKVDSLRKGKSEVIESDHTLILGWSDKLGSLLKQLSIANQSLGGGVVVVLAELDKEQMELDIAKMEFDFMGTSVICRSGSPLIMADLKKVSVSKARAIIVLAEVENADQSDARVLRVVLSLTGVREGLKGHIVVELSDLDNEQLVKLVGGDIVETVVAHDVIGRLMIQCARQPGLAQIWEDILGFDNAEFYVKKWPQLDGTKFEDVLLSFPDAIPCGVKVAANSGQIVLNPDDDYILSEGDELLVIAEDDDTYFPASVPKVRRGSLPKVVHPPKLPEKILFCGWRRDIDDMIMVLDAFLASGSELWMFSDVATGEREKKLMEGGLDPHMLMNIKLVHREGNAVIRRHLESLPLETFDSILILADEALEDTVINADSRSLATLLLIRDIQSRRMPYREQTKTMQLRQPGGSQWIREMQQASDQSIIISEILDSRTKNLVSVSKISDYVLSNELVSMALAMVAEDKQINRVLEELFAEEGNEMYIRPGEMYLYEQEELCFYDIMARARQRHEIVIGYRLASQDRAVINPPNKHVSRKWSLGDVFIVLAQEE